MARTKKTISEGTNETTKNENNTVAKPARTKTKTKTKTGVKKTPNTVRAGIPRAQEHQYFVLVDGRRLGDIKELADTLEELADHAWSHHVNEHKNDFANWIQDVFAEAELAQRLRDATGKHHAQIILYRTILERI